MGEETKSLSTDKRWIADGGKLLESALVSAFDYEYLKHFGSDIVSYNGSFYGVNGLIKDDDVKYILLGMLTPEIQTNLSRKINNVIDLMKIAYNKTEIDIPENVILFNNGDYYIDSKELKPKSIICTARLPIDFEESAQPPKKWLDFLSQLLYDEDIKTLQQFIGYCLIPSAKAQVMLSIIGEGGEGKSVVGRILSAMLGDFCTFGSIQKIASDKFYIATLADKLLFIDDDVNFSAFKATNDIKTIISCDSKMKVEEKYKQPRLAKMYCRLLCFGNNALQSLYDNSNGFWRRQVIIETKPKDENRKDNPKLFEELRNELSSIVNWALSGLYELQANNYKIHKSERIEQNISKARAESDNILAFLNDTEYVMFEPEAEVHTATLYSEYLHWCNENVTAERSRDSFSKTLSVNARKFGLERHNNLMIGDKRARGYRGIKVVQKRNLYDI